jgi:hypothetical protein
MKKAGTGKTGRIKEERHERKGCLLLHLCFPIDVDDLGFFS